MPTLLTKKACQHPSLLQRRKRRKPRRRLRTQVFIFIGIIIIGVYQYLELSIHATLLLLPTDSTLTNKHNNKNDNNIKQKESITNNQQILLRDTTGKVISRNSSSLSHYLTITTTTTRNDQIDNQHVTLEDASIGREPIISILNDAGIYNMSPLDVLLLPKWETVTNLYGSKPVIIGLDKCKEFQEKVPPSKRFMGVAGMFNSGTTAFGLLLQQNCRYPNHIKNMSNDVINDVNGILDQVPWAKHKTADNKYTHTIHPDINKDHVLPIVLIRDPYYWMQSMCKQGYGARWDHDSTKHCPNLVPNQYDLNRFKKLRNVSSVPVWMGQSLKKGPSWKSLVHYWNDWYDSYYNNDKADFPKLLIRFEDILFHGEEVIRQVCKCGGAEMINSKKQSLTYLVDEAKWSHKHEQNNMISAMVRYGTDMTRYQNMTIDDLQFANNNLDKNLMDLFHYQQHPI